MFFKQSEIKILANKRMENGGGFEFEIVLMRFL